MTSVTAIALSGGIDSLVSAALLLEQGHRVIGLHFITGYETGEDHALRPSSNGAADRLAAIARRTVEPVAQQLNIPIHIIDLHEPFQKAVVDYFVQTYGRGKTPNPCLVCNQLIKFDILFKRAQSLGATRIATGHYARIDLRVDGRHHLLRGVDQRKDQSYFLGRLSQEQLAAAVLPLGRFTKTQTRRIAREKGLVPAISLESQDVCFIREDNYSDFVLRHLRRSPMDQGDLVADFTPAPGPIEDLAGRCIGEHKGLHRFTIGQRRGINCPGAAPYYVVRIDRRRNCLVVGAKQDLLSPGCRIDNINWINRPVESPARILVRLRYRHQPVPASVSMTADTSAEVVFDHPQSAVTPGQGAVFYLDDEVLGAGWIQ